MITITPIMKKNLFAAWIPPEAESDLRCVGVGVGWGGVGGCLRACVCVVCGEVGRGGAERINFFTPSQLSQLYREERETDWLIDWLNFITQG